MRSLMQVRQWLMRLLGRVDTSYTPAEHAGSGGPSSFPLPSVRFQDGTVSPLPAALVRAPRLFLADPHGGNARVVVEAVTRRDALAAPAVRLPATPSGSPPDVASQGLEQRGRPVRRKAVEAWLTQGELVWIVAEADQTDAAAAWLDQCLTSYPHCRVLAYGTHRLPASPWQQMELAWLTPPAWPEVHRWAMTVSDARPLLVRLGALPEAQQAFAASDLLRSTGLVSLSGGGRLSGLYAGWLKALLGPAHDTLLPQAAALAWAQGPDQPLHTPFSPDLARLCWQSAPQEWAWVSPALQHYLAAWAPEASMERLASRVDDPAWREVIALWAGRAPEAADLIERLMNAEPATAGRLVLALRMVEEMAGQGQRREPVVLRVGLEHVLDCLRQGETAGHAPVQELLAALGDHQGMAAGTEPKVIAAALAWHQTPQVRLAAVKLLGALGDTATLSRRLSDDDPAVARAAAMGLAAAGPDVIPQLMTCLSDPRPSIRDTAVDALVGMAGGAAWRPLAEALTGRDAQLVSSAAVALSRLGGEAVPVLVQALAADNPVTQSAVETALVDLGRRMPDTLLSALGEEIRQGRVTSRMRERLVDVLRRIGPMSVPALVSALRQPDHPASELAAEVAADIAPHDPSVLAALSYGLGDPRHVVARRCESSLRRLDGMATPVMLQVAVETPGVRRRVFEILGNLDGVVVDSTIEGLLIETLSDSEPSVRLSAVRMLGRAASKGAVAGLVDCLEDLDSGVRLEAVRALAAMGGGTSLPHLRKTLQREQNPEVRAALVEALALQDQAAVLPIAAVALGDADDRVRKAAVSVFRRLGGRGVDALIEADVQSTSHVLRENVIDLLRYFLTDSSAPSSGQPYAVARVWLKLLNEPYSAGDAKVLASQLGEWQHAREIQREYETAEALRGYEHVREFTDVTPRLYWREQMKVWLRPQVRDILDRLDLISSRIVAAYSSSNVEGLIRQAAKLKELAATLDASRLDIRPFYDVVTHWQSLVHTAIDELEGEADLELSVITQSVWLRRNDAPVTLAFWLRNTGSDAARTIRVEVDRAQWAAAGVQVIGPTVWQPPSIEPTQAYRLEFQVLQRQMGEVSLPLRLRFEDIRRLPQMREATVRLAFARRETVALVSTGNPYIVGTPIKTAEMFFGRQNALRWIETNLVGRHTHNPLILYGERRTGKTSLLYQAPRLARFSSSQYVFALIDFQAMAQWMESTPDFYYGLSRRLAVALSGQGIPIEAPPRLEFADDPAGRFEALIGAILSNVSGRILVIMLDEFDLLLDAIATGAVKPWVADNIRALLQHEDRVAFIFAGAHRVRRMIEDPKTILFNTAHSYRVGFLKRPDAEELIRKPVEAAITYDDLAIERILEITNGHPYFIQYLCWQIYQRLEADQRNTADLTDVTEAAREAVHETTGILAHSYEVSSIEERLALAALARLASEGRRWVSIDEVIVRLDQYGIDLSRAKSEQAIRHLKERDFIDTDPLNTKRFGFAMDLARMWLAERAEDELRDLPRLLRSGLSGRVLS